jgi:hypothetical protein
MHPGRHVLLGAAVLKTLQDQSAETPALRITGPHLLISAFSLPTDFKSKTIYTVVTKPVRAGDIVLGRIVGFTIVGTLMLLREKPGAISPSSNLLKIAPMRSALLLKWL